MEKDGYLQIMLKNGEGWVITNYTDKMEKDEYLHNYVVKGRRMST